MKKRRSVIKGMLQEEAMRVVGDWRFYFSMILYVFICLMICLQQYHRWTTAINGLQYIIGLSNTGYLLALVSAYPTAASFCDDYSENYVRSAVIRSGKKCYIAAKIMTVMISTFVISFVGILIAAAVLYYKGGMGAHIVNEGQLYSGFVFGGHSGIFICLIALSHSLGLVVYAVMAISMSSILPNRFAAVTAPLLMYICIGMLTEYFPDCLNLNKMMLSENIYRLGDFRVFLLSLLNVCVYCLVASGVFSFFVRRRISNEIV